MKRSHVVRRTHALDLNSGLPRAVSDHTRDNKHEGNDTLCEVNDVVERRRGCRYLSRSLPSPPLSSPPLHTRTRTAYTHKYALCRTFSSNDSTANANDKCYHHRRRRRHYSCCCWWRCYDEVFKYTAHFRTWEIPSKRRWDGNCGKSPVCPERGEHQNTLRPQHPHPHPTPFQ